MKKFLCLLAAAAALAVSCNKEGNLVTAEFGQTFYTIYSHGSVDVPVSLSKAAAGEIKIPIMVSGDAAKNVDFSLSSDYAVFASGETGTVITVTDLDLTPDKSVTLTLGAASGVKIGTKYVTVIKLDAEEKLICNFTTSGGTLYEKLTATLTVEGVTSGKAYKAPEFLHIPVKLVGNEAGYAKVAAEEFVIPKGASSATLDILPADNIPEDLPNDVKVVIKPDGERFIQGDTGTYTVKIESGIQIPARLVGKWVFDHIYAQEELEMWLEEGEEDLTLFPFNNEGFTLEFTEEEDGTVTLTPGTTGDYAAYFTEATPIVLTTPKNISSEGIVLGKYTVQEINMFEAEETGAKSQVWTYYLIKANRAFSKSKKSVGDSVIAFRLTGNGGLDLQFRDFDTPPFGTVYWWDGEKFDPDMFGFATLFTKEE